MAYDTSTGFWSMYFDGSDVVSQAMSTPFAIMPDGTILLSLDACGDRQRFGEPWMIPDIIRFAPTSLGANTAAHSRGISMARMSV